MTDEIQKLIAALRSGDYGDPAEKISLLSAALREAETDVPFLLSLLRAPQINLRLAAMDAGRDRNEAELQQELRGLVKSPEPPIRTKLAEILEMKSDPGAVDALRTLILDTDANVRVAAIKSTGGRPEFRDDHVKCLLHDSVWTVRIASVNALSTPKDPQLIQLLCTVLHHDHDSDVRQRCAEIIEARLQGQFLVY